MGSLFGGSVDRSKGSKHPRTDRAQRGAPKLPNAEALSESLYQRAYGWIRRHVGARAAAVFITLVVALIGLNYTFEILGKFPEIKKDLEIVPGFSTASEWLYDITRPLVSAGEKIPQ
jgi:hypothetical protein